MKRSLLLIAAIAALTAAALGVSASMSIGSGSGSVSAALTRGSVATSSTAMIALETSIAPSAATTAPVEGIAAQAAATTVTTPGTTAPVAMLSTIDGVRLWSRSAESPRAVASTIKMLNALVVRERTRLDDVVIVTKKSEAITDGDVGLVAGQRLKVRQLLDMMLIASANDAAEALAIHIGGTEARYVSLMNAKAKQLGLKQTRAADPHGLSKRERSSACDLTVLGKRVLADPVLKSIVRKQSVLVPRPGGKSVVFKSTYHLMGDYWGIEGVKTGYTRASGYCFVSAAKRGKVELVGVVLGAKSNKDRFAQMRKILNWGFANTHVRNARVHHEHVHGVGTGTRHREPDDARCRPSGARARSGAA